MKIAIIKVCMVLALTKGAYMQDINYYEDRSYSILTADCTREYITDEEYNLLLRCVMSEAGGEGVDCQEAVATVILNRWQDPDGFEDTLTGVITSPGQFSTHDNGAPTDEVKEAVDNAIYYYNTALQCIPSEVLYFRSGHYHNFGFPYISIDDLYFSTNKEVLL